ncbi:MAG: hypothetical protein ACREP7_23210 [Lysobacter sp.]
MRARRCAQLILFSVLNLIAVQAVALAECDESEVVERLKEGSTVSQVADECEMSKEVVRYILGRQDKPPVNPLPSGKPSNLLPRGTPVGQCGCWGYVDPNFSQPHQQCESGSARPQMCAAPCSAGGFMWQGVCT